MSLLSRILGGSRLRLTQKLGAYPLPEGDISPLYVFFGVENTGREEIEVVSVSLTPRGGDESLPVGIGGEEVPVTLPSGESVRYEVRARELAKTANDAGYSGSPRLSLAVSDSEGRKYRHDFTLRVDEYLALRDE